METFKERQKEMRELEHQRDKSAKPTEIHADEIPAFDPSAVHPRWARRSSIAGKRNLVEIRYLGFDQRENSRVYRFDVQTDGQATKEVSVSADMVAFRDHRVGIQEGPCLSRNKLTADLGRGWEGEHELTAADLRAYADAKALADAQRAGTRKAPRRGVQAEIQQKSPWRNLGI